jgi:2-oxoisovalerate dehydrogenase E1 component alpha subunit
LGARRVTVTQPRHVELGLDDGQALRLYRLLLLTRRLDERIWRLNRQGAVPFAIPCRGQEAAQVGSALAARPGLDILMPYPRDLGVVLAAGMTPFDVLLSALARAGDPSAGRQLPMHWMHPRLRIMSSSSPVGTQIPQAAGLALAVRARGESAVIICYFGDGATSKSDLHEGVNFATVNALPVVFFCQNNGYATSLPTSRQIAGGSVSAYAASLGLPAAAVDGNDPLAVFDAARQAVDRARAGNGPTLIEALTYRLLPHTSDDEDSRYRSSAELDEAVSADPLPRYRDYLAGLALLAASAEQALEAEVLAEIDAALARAQSASEPDAASATSHLYAH